MYPRITRVHPKRGRNDEIQMTKLEGMTNDQMMSKRFDLLMLQRFNAFTLQDLSIRHWPFRS